MILYRRRLLFAGLAIFLITLLINLPADRVLYLFREQLPAGTGWQRVSGSVFHSTFYNLMIRLSDKRSLLIESAEVRIAILPLLLGRLKLKFDLWPDEGGISGVIILNQRGWQLPQIEGSLSLQRLSMLLPELKMAGPTGRIVFSGDTLAGEYHKLTVTGGFEANIEDLQPGLLNIQRPLGSYSVQLQAVDGDAIQGKVETISADAQLSVQGQLSLDPVGSTLQFEGQAWVAADAPDSIQGLLSLLGPVEQGRARIQWQGSL